MNTHTLQLTGMNTEKCSRTPVQMQQRDENFKKKQKQKTKNSSQRLGLVVGHQRVRLRCSFTLRCVQPSLALQSAVCEDIKSNGDFSFLFFLHQCKCEFARCKEMITAPCDLFYCLQNRLYYICLTRVRTLTIF